MSEFPDWLASTLASDATAGQGVLPPWIGPLKPGVRAVDPAFVALMSQDDNLSVREAMQASIQPGSILAVEGLSAQVVSTGAAHLLVPVRNREAIKRAQPDAKSLYKQLRSVEGQGCYLFSLDPADPAAVASTRFFNPTVGIVEDPATGSAAGPLACYLAEKEANCRVVEVPAALSSSQQLPGVLMFAQSGSGALQFAPDGQEGP
jgi:Phenazine biosynthesis-like protein